MDKQDIPASVSNFKRNIFIVVALLVIIIPSSLFFSGAFDAIEAKKKGSTLQEPATTSSTPAKALRQWKGFSWDQPNDGSERGDDVTVFSTAFMTIYQATELIETLSKSYKLQHSREKYMSVPKEDPFGHIITLSGKYGKIKKDKTLKLHQSMVFRLHNINQPPHPFYYIQTVLAYIGTEINTDRVAVLLKTADASQTTLLGGLPKDFSITSKSLTPPTDPKNVLFYNEVKAQIVPEEELDFPTSQYSLHLFIQNVSDDHYIVYFKDDDRWVKIDGEHVEYPDAKIVQNDSKAAYLYLYRRTRTSLPTAPKTKPEN